MENNELFKTIERLKESLAEVESARQQVSETVAAYSDTQKEIGSYAAKLNDIKSALNGLITLLQNHKVIINEQSSQAVANLSSTCNTIITNADSKLSRTSAAFASASEASIMKMKEQQRLFDETIEKAGAIKNEVTALASSIRTIQTEFSLSQKAQDEAISRIDKTVNSISSQLSTTDTTINGISNVLATHGNSLADVKQSLNSLSTSIAQLSTSVQNLQSTIVQRVNNAQSQLEQQVVSLGQDVTTRHDELKNKVSTLQTLLIVQLVISVITIIIMFVLK
ncbi:MAG: hypothetical protein IJ724_08850 [Muribaculaceae bacterium]|nr:hypothetical protein [Muribaculaceae bacterium]